MKLVKLHQCLFGYDDGHRKLASSVRLPDAVETQLLLLTDMAPGLNTAEVKPYWTGTPVPALKSYALIKTWPAPEMPRPGCVWSHVLLLQFSDIPQFESLASLSSWFRRPDLEQGVDAYSKSLELSTSTVGLIPGLISDANALRVVRALYRNSEEGFVAAPQGTLDATIFAVWSQQWPKLRRTFSFRSAVSPSENRQTFKFHLRIIVGAEAESSDRVASLDGWEAAAIADLRSSEPTDFRRFLWRYGSDLRNGIRKFQFLADLFTSIHANRLSSDELANVLCKIQQTLPLKDDGALLKEDLLLGKHSEYSLLPSVDRMDVLEYFLNEDVVESFPIDPEHLINAVFADGERLTARLVSNAERATSRQTPLALSFVDKIIEVASPLTFLLQTKECPNLRYRAIHSRPELLDSEELPSIDVPHLSTLISFLPSDADVTERVIERLLTLEDSSIASQVFVSYSAPTIRAVMHRVQKKLTDRTQAVSSVWLRGVNDRVDELLTGEYLNTLGSTSAIAAMAEALGYDRSGVLRHGPLPWVAALRGARPDATGEQLQVLAAFLIVLALEKPVRGSETIFEFSFDLLHSALMTSSLSPRAFAMLTRYLPDLWWWQQWDTALRLRLAVTKAYEKGHLDSSRFRNLTNDHAVSKQLDDLRGGKSNRSDFID